MKPPWNPIESHEIPWYSHSLFRLVMFKRLQRWHQATPMSWDESVKHHEALKVDFTDAMMCLMIVVLCTTGSVV